MTEDNNSNNQRNQQRYSIKSGAFALLTSNDQEILGSIKDISRNGLCLTHIDEHDDFNGSRITINLISEKKCFENFPCRIIWNKKEEGGFRTAMIKMRCRGIKFEDLEPDKEQELYQFIDALKL